MSLGSLGNNDGNVLRKRNSISEFALLQTLSRLFQLVQFVKCWQIFLELNSKRLYQSLQRCRELWEKNVWNLFLVNLDLDS